MKTGGYYYLNIGNIGYTDVFNNKYLDYRKPVFLIGNTYVDCTMYITPDTMRIPYKCIEIFGGSIVFEYTPLPEYSIPRAWTTNKGNDVCVPGVYNISRFADTSMIKLEANREIFNIQHLFVIRDNMYLKVTKWDFIPKSSCRVIYSSDAICVVIDDLIELTERGYKERLFSNYQEAPLEVGKDYFVKLHPTGAEFVTHDGYGYNSMGSIYYCYKGANLRETTRLSKIKPDVQYRLVKIQGYSYYIEPISDAPIEKSDKVSNAEVLAELLNISSPAGIGVCSHIINNVLEMKDEFDSKEKAIERVRGTCCLNLIRLVEPCSFNGNPVSVAHFDNRKDILMHFLCGEVVGNYMHKALSMGSYIGPEIKLVKYNNNTHLFDYILNDGMTLTEYVNKYYEEGV